MHIRMYGLEASDLILEQLIFSRSRLVPDRDDRSRIAFGAADEYADLQYKKAKRESFRTAASPRLQTDRHAWPFHFLDDTRSTTPSTAGTVTIVAPSFCSIVN